MLGVVVNSKRCSQFQALVPAHILKVRSPMLVSVLLTSRIANDNDAADLSIDCRELVFSGMHS